MFDNSSQCDRSGQVQRISIDSCAERGKSNALNLILFGQVQTALVSAGQETLILTTTAIDRPDSMEDVPGRELAGRRRYGATGRTTVNLAALGHNARATCTVNGPIDATPASKRRISGIHNGIRLHPHNISLQQCQGHAMNRMR